MAVSNATSSPGEQGQLYHQSLISSPVLCRPSHSTTVLEGRVGKSSRRRSRTSRRAPTTLLNTDTTNFRALVQHFTGVSSSGPYTTTIAGYGEQPFGLQQQYQIQQQYHQQPPEQFMVGSSGDVFYSGNPMEATEGFLLDGEMTWPPTGADGRVGAAAGFLW